MLDKQTVEDMCKALAAEHPGWEYSNKAFKNKSLKYTTKLIDFGWSYNSLCSNFQPLVGVSHKKICQLYKKIFDISMGWNSGYLLTEIAPEYRKVNFFTDYTQPGHDYDYMNQLIRQVFARCMQEMDRIYDFSSENNLIDSFPPELKLQRGELYCLSRAYVGDFEYVRRYRLRQLDGVDCDYSMYEHNIEKIIAYFNISMK